jgi:hypothetical protein
VKLREQVLRASLGLPTAGSQIPHLFKLLMRISKTYYGFMSQMPLEGHILRSLFTSSEYIATIGRSEDWSLHGRDPCRDPPPRGENRNYGAIGLHYGESLVRIWGKFV